MRFDSNSAEQRLYSAASGGNFELVKSIIEEEKSNPQFNINYLNPSASGQSILWIACSWGFLPTPYRRSDYLEIIEYLIAHGADVNFLNKDGKSPLYIAAAWGHPHIVRLLISHDADLNVQVQIPGQSNFAPIHIAAYSMRSPDRHVNYTPPAKHHAFYCAKEYMEKILKYGEDSEYFPEVLVDYTTLDDYSAKDPLFDIPNEIMDVTVKYNHFVVVKELVNAKADINIPDKEGYTALKHARRWGHAAIEKLLLEHGAIEKIETPIKQETSQT